MGALAKLGYLNLGANEIGDEGAAAIAKALEVNKTLTELILWGNEIGDEGASALAKGLTVNATLHSLVPLIVPSSSRSVRP